MGKEINPLLNSKREACIHQTLKRRALRPAFVIHDLKRNIATKVYFPRIFFTIP